MKAMRFTTLLAALLVVSAAAETFVDVSASGGGQYVCRVDGVERSRHNSEYKAANQADNLKLSNPDSSVICEQNRTLVATLTAAGKKLIADAAAGVLIGEQSDYPVGIPLIIDEDFSVTPLANDQNPYYDDGTAFDKCPMPVTGSDALCYQWTAGDVGSNGLQTWRAHFLDSSNTFFPQSEFEIEFDFATTANFDDVNPGATGPHLFYIRTNQDGLYGDNTTIYLEPDGDGNFWVDLNKSDDPAEWQEVRQTTNVDTMDGAVHHVKFRMKENTTPSATDGIIQVWVDDTLVVDRSDLNILVYPDQHVQNISFGPYIVGSTNSAAGAVAVYVDNLVVRSITPATSSGGVSPGTFEFAQAAYSIEEDNLTLAVTVERNGGSDGAATVDVASTNGTAIAPGDFTAISQTLSFADAEVSKSFNVTVVDDASAEGDETFTMSLSNATGGASVGGINDTTVTIQDPAAAPSVTLTVDDPVSAWGHDEVVFTVRIAATQGVDVPFTYATSNAGSGAGFAAAGTDYTATSGSSSIPAGSLYQQIAVPINGNEPSTGMDIFTFTATDADLNDATGTGRIVDAYYISTFDYPSVGASPKRNWWQDDLAGTWSNGTLVPTGNASIGSTVPCAIGVNCLRHNMFTTVGAQSTIGTDSNATMRVGDIFDGLEYYYLVYMRIDPGFIWNDGATGHDKMKAGRMVRIAGVPQYSTPYLYEDRWYWALSYPDSASIGQSLFYDFDAMDDGNWHEVIVYQKRSTDYQANDGEGRLVVDCVLQDTALNIDWTEQGQTEPGDADADDVRVTNMGLFGYFQNQIGKKDTAGFPTGGVMYTDNHMATDFWPSVDCARPW